MLSNSPPPSKRQDVFTSVIQKQSVNGMFGLAKEFFKDASASMLTIRLTDSGATLGLVGDFKPETPLGKFVVSQAAGDQTVSLKGLPAGNFLLAGAMKINGETLAPVFSSFFDQMLTDPALAKDDRAAQLRQAFELSKPMIAMMHVCQLRLPRILPPAEKMATSTGAFPHRRRRSAEVSNVQLRIARNPAAQVSMDPDYKQTYTVSPDAVTIKDVHLNKINVTFRAPRADCRKPHPPREKTRL